MRIWFGCFVVLFAIAELFDWVQQLHLPLPIHVLGGVFLAIASNYNKRPGLSWRDSSDISQQYLSVNPPSQDINQSQGKIPPQPISFTIRKN